MKHLIPFDNFSKVNEMFDDEHLKNKNEIAFLSKSIDTEALSKTTTSYSHKINNIILNKIPFYKKGNPEVYPDMVIYRFGDYENTLVIVIGGYLINDKYHTNSFSINFYIEKKGICINPNDVEDIYNIHEIIEYLKTMIPTIKKQFKAKEVTLN